MAVENRPEHAEDLIELLLGQHMLIRDLFLEVQSSSGDGRREAFERLVRLLAVHETAEEEIVHPMARRDIEGGDAIVEQRLGEEKQAKEVLSRLETMDLDSERFDEVFADFRASVLEHAVAEETYEFRYLRQHYTRDRLRSLAGRVRLAEKTAPTHPHPGVETALENLAAGPVMAVFDRVKDAMRGSARDD